MKMRGILAALAAAALLQAHAVYAAKPAVSNKLQFQYLVFPGTVQVDTAGTMALCMVNNGGAEWVSPLDQVLITLPYGTAADDLVYDAVGLTCTPQSPAWSCGVQTVTADKIIIGLWPQVPVEVVEGETIYFNLDNAFFNGEAGLSFLTVDQQIDPAVAAKAANSTLGMFKATAANVQLTETDPTVEESVKDGVAWSELQDMPPVLKDGKVQWGELEDVSTTLKDGEVHWNEVKEKPSDLHDGKIAWGEIKDMPPHFTNGLVDWAEVQNRPADLSDSKISWAELENVSTTLKDGEVHWTEVKEKPSDLGDGKIAWGEIKDMPAHLANGLVDWTEVQNRPADLADSKISWSELLGVPDLATKEYVDSKVGSGGRRNLWKEHAGTTLAIYPGGVDCVPFDTVYVKVDTDGKLWRKSKYFPSWVNIEGTCQKNLTGYHCRDVCMEQISDPEVGSTGVSMEVSLHGVNINGNHGSVFMPWPY